MEKKATTLSVALTASLKAAVSGAEKADAPLYVWELHRCDDPGPEKKNMFGPDKTHIQQLETMEEAVKEIKIFATKQARIQSLKRERKLVIQVKMQAMRSQQT